MTIKNTAVATSFLLAMGLSSIGFAETKTVDVDGVAVECITAAAAEAMSDEDKSKLTMPICEDLQKQE